MSTRQWLELRPKAISKWSCSNVGFACSHVMKGTGLGVAIACGNDSEVGLMARLSMEQRPISRERKRMSQIAYCTAVVGTFSVITFLWTITMPGLSYKLNFRFNLGLMIALIPLFLPTVIYFGLVHISNRMSKNNCYIRNLESSSTLGLTTVICSDMTGTLTKNKMRVTEIFVNADLLNVDNLDNSMIGGPRFLELIRVSVLCNDAVISHGTEGVPKLLKHMYGSEFDKALLRFALSIIDDIHLLRHDHQLLASKSYNAFDHVHTTVHRTTDEDGNLKYILLMKGRCKAVLKHCNTYAIDNEEILLNDNLLISIEDVASQLIQAGRHVFAFAYKELNNELEYKRMSYSNLNSESASFKAFLNNYISSLRFLGLIAAHDPPRAQLSTAVGQCRTAGIKLVLITPQSVNAAQNIARDVGIIGPRSETVEEVARRLNIEKSQVKQSLVTAAVIDMSDYAEMKAHHQRFHIQQLLLVHVDLVFAATSSSQRHMIVDVCQKLGAIVTIIGSGVYCTPALRRANVGVAKGDSACPSLSCADMILLDSNFVSLVNAIAMSRSMYENFKKVLTYCLSTNLTVILINVSLISLKIPFRIYITVIFIISIFVDMLPSLTLFYEKPEENLMKQKPKIYDDFIINRRIIMVAYVLIGSIEAAAVFVNYFINMAENGFLPNTLFGLSIEWYDESKNDIIDTYGQEWSIEARRDLQNKLSSITLMTMTIMQCTNLILCKTVRANLLFHGFKNILLNMAVIYLLIFFYLLKFVDSRNYLHLVPIEDLSKFIYVWPFVFVLLLFETARRYFLRRFPDSWLEVETLY